MKNKKYDALEILRQRAENNPELKELYLNEKERFNSGKSMQNNTKYIHSVVKVCAFDYDELVEIINQNLEEFELSGWELMNINYFNMESRDVEFYAFLLFKREDYDEPIS